MKRLFVLFFIAQTVLTAMNQQQDATAVYSEFSRHLTVIQTHSASSEEYKNSYKAMLNLYNQLQYHAAKYSQQNKQANALTFAKAYVDMAMMPEFEQMHLEKSEPYASMTYFVASIYYNRKDYRNAATYLQRYIDLGESNRRAMVYRYLAQTQEMLADTEAEISTLDAGLREFPTNQDLLTLSINMRMSKGYYDEALPYIERAAEINTNDKNYAKKLLSLKGQCLEGLGRYEEAVDLYSRLAEQQKTLNIYEHYAINLYNCAVQHYSTDKSKAHHYFMRAIPVLKQVVESNPTSVSFTNSLAMAYLYTDQFDLVEQTNSRLRTMGAPEVVVGSVVGQPALLVSDLHKPTIASASSLYSSKTPQNTAPTPSQEPTPKSQNSPQQGATQADVEQTNQKDKLAKEQSDKFRLFAKNYIEKEVLLWQQKDPFETVGEYKQRVTEENRNKKIEDLMVAAKKEYISRHAKQLRISEFMLQPYDAENRVFLIESPYGDMILPVPRENDEARNFATNWKDIRVENAQYDIAGDEIVIRAIDFITKSGKIYHYSDKDEMKYNQMQIQMQFGDIDYASLSTGAKKTVVQKEQTSVSVGKSDVDIDIPQTKSVNKNTFAFLIGNEHYPALADVEYAINDMRSIGEYLKKTLGVPQSNIRTYEDATFGKILSCMRDIRAIADAYNGNIDIVFYYAGHGMPDEASRTAYLLPVDADGTQTETCYAISRLYSELGQTGANKIVVLLDACFSGSQRGEGMLASARGVALRAKPDAPQGKMVVMSAASGEETAYPYYEHQHGMFTYFLLKYMQDTKGKINMGELADYVQTQVRQQSVVINRRSQTPTVNASAEASDWRKWNWK